jgi:hypothetical protein
MQIEQQTEKATPLTESTTSSARSGRARNLNSSSKYSKTSLDVHPTLVCGSEDAASVFNTSSSLETLQQNFEDISNQFDPEIPSSRYKQRGG